MIDNANIAVLADTPGHEIDEIIKELLISVSKVRCAALSLETSVCKLEDGTDLTKKSVEALA
jgi:exonuclease VII small subunit